MNKPFILIKWSPQIRNEIIFFFQLIAQVITVDSQHKHSLLKHSPSWFPESVSFTTSMNLICHHPLFLLPASSILNIFCPAHPQSIHCTYRLSQPFLLNFVSKTLNVAPPTCLILISPFWSVTIKILTLPPPALIPAFLLLPQLPN